jgi:hypothetical protein
MHPFSVGEIVVCVDDTPLPDRARRHGEDWISQGKFYRVAATLSDRLGNVGIRVEGVKDMPPRVGWFAWRFKRLENADGDFREMMNCLTRPKTDLEVAVQQSLAETALHEGTICTYVPGMASSLASQKYAETFGAMPAWARGLHPRRRTALICLALHRGDPLPQLSPASWWVIDCPGPGFPARLLQASPRSEWRQPPPNTHSLNLSPHR